MHRQRAEAPASGWGWLEAAVWEAVEAGSAFVAPRRLREILGRWEREGFPAPADSTRDESPSAFSRPMSTAPEPPRQLPPVFTIEEIGLSSRQVWAAVLAEVARQGQISPADLETWLRPAALIGREGDTLLIGEPNAVARERLATRLLTPLLAAITATVGLPLAVEVVVESGSREGEEARRHGG
jgi:hypothetical protein